MFKRRSNSISSTILAAVLIISSIVTSIMTFIQLEFDYFQDKDAVEKSLNLVDESYKNSIASSLWDLNDAQLKVEMKGILRIPSIQYVQIVDQGKVLSEVGSLPRGKALKKTFSLVRNNGDTSSSLGQLVVFADLDQIMQRLYKKIIFVFITQLVKTILVSFVVYFVINKILTRHLVDISFYLKNIDFMNLQQDEFRLKRKTRICSDGNEQGGDELDTLVKIINRMRENIHHSQTELRIFNQQLEQKVQEKMGVIIEQRQKLEYSSKMTALGEMAGGVAHEINTPLAVIQMIAEQMGEILEDEPKLDLSYFKKNLDKIISTTARIAKIVKAMRFFSRSGTDDPLVTTPIETLWADTIELCKNKFESHQIDLKFDPIPKSAQIHCNPVQISQVLLNLLYNAHDAIENLPEKWIRFSVQDSEDFVEMTVTDSGKGIMPEIRDKIMQPFFTTKDIGKGTGLGLSISKGIIENHDGTLILDTSCANTQFVIRLPKAQNLAKKAA